MNPWVESLLAVLLAAGGVLVGAWFSRRRYWYLGYVLPLTIIVAYTVASRVPALGFVPPFSWMLLGRGQLAVMGLVATMVLTAPMLKLPRRRGRNPVAHISASVQ
jgi:hypothetical protein